MFGLLAVLGAFVAAGILGGLVADALGYWETPGAGFAAALAVVLVSYLAAPTHKLPASIAALALGASVAWHFLVPSFYPESYETKAYEPTYLPLIATYVGGAVGLILAVVHWRSLQARMREAAR